MIPRSPWTIEEAPGGFMAWAPMIDVDWMRWSVHPDGRVRRTEHTHATAADAADALVQRMALIVEIEVLRVDYREARAVWAEAESTLNAILRTPGYDLDARGAADKTGHGTWKKQRNLETALIALENELLKTAWRDDLFARILAGPAQGDALRNRISDTELLDDLATQRGGS